MNRKRLRIVTVVAGAALAAGIGAVTYNAHAASVGTVSRDSSSTGGTGSGARIGSVTRDVQPGGSSSNSGARIGSVTRSTDPGRSAGSGPGIGSVERSTGSKSSSSRATGPRIGSVERNSGKAASSGSRIGSVNRGSSSTGTSSGPRIDRTSRDVTPSGGRVSGPRILR